jgi:tRNA-2-methylthio-N6-dimethylallyladenosine synthase
VTVEVTYAAPHHLVADSGVRALRRTRAGDAWAARNGRPVQEKKPDVLLGMPRIGVPAEQPAPAGGCCEI